MVIVEKFPTPIRNFLVGLVFLSAIAVFLALLGCFAALILAIIVWAFKTFSLHFIAAVIITPLILYFIAGIGEAVYREWKACKR